MQEFTVKEFAGKERVTTRTVRTWIAKGAVDVRRTPGGGIRIVERRSDSRAIFVSDVMKSDEDRGSLSE